jgi:hypothetical protein
VAISVTAPISPAIRRAKWITFQPFDIRKWFVLGFCAFLASLGEGGYNFNFNGGGGGGGGRPRPVGGPTVRVPAPGGTRGVPAPASTGPAPSAGPIDDLLAWAAAHRLEAALIVVAAAVVVIAIGLAVMWLSSRGKFMFLDGVARNTAEVVAPWRRFRRHGNSLFAFRVLLAVITGGVTLLVAGGLVLVAWPDIQGQTFGTNALVAVVLGLVLILPVMILSGLINWCTENFVTVIMYARDATVVPAWREFRHNVLAGHVGTLVLFFLMEILLGIGVGVIGLVLGCLTLCIGFLPYLSSVITLPLAVFMRSYAVYFLQQFGPQYVILYEPPPVGYGFPVVMYPPPPTTPPSPPAAPIG